MTIEVFQISPYLQSLSPIFIPLAHSMMIIFFLIAIGIYALNAFEGVNLEIKVLHLVLCAIFITAWPETLMILKGSIDTFDTILIRSVFKMDWDGGIGASLIHQISSALQYKLPESLSQSSVPYVGPVLNEIHGIAINFLNAGVLFLLNAAVQVLTWFFLFFFFLYAVIGPLVIARSVLAEEIASFLALIKEVVILLLWQTTFVLLIGLINTSIGSSHQIIAPGTNIFLGLAEVFAITILIFFVPFMTRKFASNISGSILSPGFRWGGAALGITAASWALKSTFSLPRKAAGLGLAEAAAEGGVLSHIGEKASEFGEFIERSSHHAKLHKTEHESHHHKQEADKLHMENHAAEHAAHDAAETIHEHADHGAEETEGEAEHAAHSIEASHSAHPPEDHGGGGSEGPHITHIDEYVEVENIIVQAAEPKTHKGLRGLFSKSKSPSRAKLEKEMKEALEIEKHQILLIRGRTGSEKFKDLEKVKINHEDFNSLDIEKVRRYRRAIEDFNRRFGFLYDFRGNFVGKEEERPR